MFRNSVGNNQEYLYRQSIKNIAQNNLRENKNLRQHNESEWLIKKEVAKDKKRREDDAIELETRQALRQVTNTVNKTSNIVGDISRVLFSIIYYIELYGPAVKSLLTAVPIISMVLIVLSSMLKGVFALVSSDEHPATRAMKVATAIAAITLSILGFIFIGALASSTLFVIAAVTDLVHNAWEVGDLLCQRFFGQQKKNRQEISLMKNEMLDKYQEYNNLKNQLETAKLAPDSNPANINELELRCRSHEKEIVNLNNKIIEKKNIQLDQDAKLANKIQSTILCAAVVAGTVLMFTPFAAVGAAIIIGVALYSIVDKLELNPFKWLAKKMFGDPFEPKKPVDDFNQVKAKLDNKIALKNASMQNPDAANNVRASTKDIYQAIGVHETTAQQNTTSNNNNPQQIVEKSVMQNLSEPSNNVEESVALLRMR